MHPSTAQDSATPVFDLQAVIVDYAEHAARHASGIAQCQALWPTLPSRPAARAIVADLMAVADWLAVGGCRDEHARSWLAVAAGAPSEAEWIRLSSMLSTSNDPASEFAAWRARVPATLAPLAWAAGLSPDEAAICLVVGNGDEGLLGALAALRGYRFPA